jgi:cytoskeleton protein RodZ
MSEKEKQSKTKQNQGSTLDSKTDLDMSENIGALLVEARKNLDLSISDIATQLNLSKQIINQLENNQFSGNLPLAFVRGYVISYATKVGLDASMIKKAFDSQMGEEPVSLKRVESLSVFEKNRKKLNSNSTSIKLISLLIILVVIFFAGKAGWNKYKSVSTSDNIQLGINAEANSVASNEVLLDTPTDDDENFLVKASDVSSVNYVGDNESASEVEQASSFINSNEKLSLEKNESTLSVEEPLNSNSSEVSKRHQQDDDISELFAPLESIMLSFSADCWVQIIDASSNELAFGIKNAGKVMNLQGIPPISVILGDPSVVELIYKDDDIDLSQYRAKRRVKITLK